MNITIKDIAKHSGVSIATVSRVINQNYYVSPELVDKVAKAVKDLGYIPNSIARSLKNESTLTIGFLVSDISNNYFTTIAKAIEDVMGKEHYSIIVCSTENKKDREMDYLNLLLSKKVDGLIINTTGENDEFISSISQGLPIVLIDRKIKRSDFKGDFVDSNNMEGTYMLVNHLISLGHRKIGIINGELKVSTGRERFEGFKKAMQEVGINVGEDYRYRFDGNFTMESGYQGAARMMDGADRPTAVAIMNNAMTMGALKFFRTHEVNVPADISVASYGNISNIELMYVQPSIVTLNAWLEGKRAGELILERIRNNSISNREIIYTPQLVAGTGVKSI